MLTDKKRPQLEPDELRQVKWILGGLLGLLGLTALLFLEMTAWPFLVAGGLLVAATLRDPGLPARVPRWVHKVVFPAIVAFGSFDLYANGEPVSAAVRLTALLLLYRMSHYRKRRDDLQLIVLGFFLVVMAGVVSASMAFALQIVAYVAVSMLLLMVVTLLEPYEAGPAPVEPAGLPAWVLRRRKDLGQRLRAVCDWRVFSLGAVMFAGFVVLTAVLFMAIPRFQLDSGLSLDRLMKKKSSSGFTDVLKFGDVTDIQQDNGVVLRVEVPDRSMMPATPYWRMVVLDEYKAGTFRSSAQLKRTAYLRSMTSARLPGVEMLQEGAQGQWTFYLEPDAGRYLPLLGAFREMLFTEQLEYRWSPALRLVELGRDPMSMKAYRVEGMQTGGRLNEGARASSPEMVELRAKMLELGLQPEDEARVKGFSMEITGGKRLSAEVFSQAAMLWLAKHHGYALKSELPSGGGDPLVRWMASAQPGHCELFAGAFTLLARAAGYPTRIVSGYLGGAWNEDYLMVRNSDAHAWCEIYTGRGQWARMDPTNDGQKLLQEERGISVEAVGVAPVRKGWASRLDRLRMLWYRRVVSFDHTEQRQLVDTLKTKAEGAGTLLRQWSVTGVRVLRSWLARPWSPGRASVWGASLIGAGVLMYFVVRYAGRWWCRRQIRLGLRLDPVRKEAGHWLRRWRTRSWPLEQECVEADLLCLRYGNPEVWPEPADVFRRARKEWRGRER